VKTDKAIDAPEVNASQGSFINQNRRQPMPTPTRGTLTIRRAEREDVPAITNN
jgi:hypothetical protein